MWGIGRELYKWKHIWIEFDSKTDKKYGYNVKKIEYDENGEPLSLVITNVKGIVCYELKGKKQQHSKKQEKANNNTKAEEKDDTSENNEVTERSNDTQEELSAEEKAKMISKENNKVWTDIKYKIQEMAFEEDAEFDAETLKNILTKEPFTYLTQKLRINYQGKKPINIELTHEDRKPLLKKNTVVLVDETFYNNLRTYLQEEVFLPF